MRVRIFKSRGFGRIDAPTSKSMSHRMLIAASLSPKVSTVRGINLCDDVKATIEALKSLGAEIEMCEDIARVRGVAPKDISPPTAIDCHESGSTLRFIIPIAALSQKTTVFKRGEGLIARPLFEYERIFKERGLNFNNGLELSVSGPLSAGEYKLCANVSSQFISGLIFALPTLEGDSKIIIEPPFESRPYVDMTLVAVREFGIRADFYDENTILIPGNQTYAPQNVKVEADYSSAAFLDALSLLGGEVEVLGLSELSAQGDRVYRDYYQLLRDGCPTLSVKDCPDLAPVIMALASALNGATLTDTQRLRYKESDRAEAMANELTKLGVRVNCENDKITVYPCRVFNKNALLDGHNDHRIVMALSVLLTAIGGEIDGCEAVAKSYPSFFRDLRSLGIRIELY